MAHLTWLLEPQKSCTECRLKIKKCPEQRMKMLPNHWTSPGPRPNIPISDHRPLQACEVSENDKQETDWEGMESHVHVHIKFSCACGVCQLLFYRQLSHGSAKVQVCGRVESLIQSENGEQLVAASKQLQALDTKEITEQAGETGIEWQLVPTGGKHVNRRAE